MDIDRPGLTFTVDTLRDLTAARPEADLYFITGADAIEQIMRWKDTDEMFRMAHFVGVTRPGHHLSLHGLPADRVSELEIPALAISSTDIRRPRRGRAPGLVPGAGRRGAVHRQARACTESRRA